VAGVLTLAAREAAEKGSRTPSVVFLSPTGQIGGAERVLLDLIAGLRQRHAGWELTVILSADGPLSSAARRLGAKTEVLAFPAALAALGDATVRSGGGRLSTFWRAACAMPAVMRYAMSLRAVLQRARPSVIHSNGAKMHLLASYSARGVAPLVWHLHEYAGARPLMRRALRACATAPAAVIANSHSVAADARVVLGQTCDIRTVANGVDLQRFTPLGARLDLDALATFGTPPSDVVRIGLVATFATWKGHDVFFRALAQLPRDTAWRAYVIGGPLYETLGSQRTQMELEQMAIDAGVREMVGFTGSVFDVPAALRALDIVVHASTLPEPFGLVLAEAMACGRPVVTSGTGGAVEVANAGAGAVVVHSTPNATPLADALTSLLRNAPARAALGRQARLTAEQRHGLQRFVSELLAVYSAPQVALRGP
jgi:glycosyltransferase involved in cell wall biosynthesis